MILNPIIFHWIEGAEFSQIRPLKTFHSRASLLSVSFQRQVTDGSTLFIPENARHP